MTEGRQLAFDLPHRVARGREDFLVSASNAAAVTAIDSWPDWPHSGLVLVGPAGSGKSHLVEVWRQRSGARRIGAREVAGDPAAVLSGASALAIEDCGPDIDQDAMFHLLNAAERAATSILITADSPPPAWRIGLPDLMSRLSRLPVVEVNAPDDMLLSALLVKHFADRQLSVDEPLIRYLSARIERSFAAVRDTVERLDRAAIEAKRPVTRAFAARILGDGHGWTK